jgi:hypothetical protein
MRRTSSLLPRLDFDSYNVEGKLGKFEPGLAVVCGVLVVGLLIMVLFMAGLVVRRLWRRERERKGYFVVGDEDRDGEV